MSLALRSELLLSYGFRHGFSLRSGGVSERPYDSLNLGRGVGDDPAAVEENHRRFAAAVGFDPTRLYEATQVHGGAVLVVDDAVAPLIVRQREADALVSAISGAAVGVRVADCAAVLLADPATGMVAAVHAGWRGVVAGVISNAVRVLSDRTDVEPGRLLAAVFPCIGLESFEVGEEVAEQIAEASSASVVQRGGSRPHVDLARAVRIQLLAAGLTESRVDAIAGCTYTEPERYYSFRRDGARSGRHLAAIAPQC